MVPSCNFRHSCVSVTYRWPARDLTNFIRIISELAGSHLHHRRRRSTSSSLDDLRPQRHHADEKNE
jgi:hypothetical protein